MEKLNCSVYEMSDSIEELINAGAVVPIYVSGSSMNPFLVSRRDIVYLKHPEDTDIKRGRILLYRRKDGSFVLHRVLKINPDSGIVLNGDAQKWCETVKKSQIIAVVCEIERKGRIKSTESFYWKAIDFFWRILTPLRSLIMRVWYKLRRIKNNK